MAYTLKMTSLDWLAQRPEHREITVHSARELSAKGWSVAIIDIPSYRRNDGEMSVPRQRIEVTRELGNLGLMEVPSYWDTKLIGHNAERIGVTFSDARILKMIGKEWESNVVRHGSVFGAFWWSWDCTIPDQVEIFVEGGSQNGQDNFLKFMATLNSWDMKFRIMKKLHHLTALATQHNQGGIDRLQGEINMLLTLL